MTKSFDNAKVLCLNVELELKSEKENAEVRISDPDDYQSIVDAEWKIIYDKLALCVECGANVVLSKLPIGDLATQYFADRGLFCAGRVAADDLGRVCKATGAVIQTSVQDMDRPGVLGLCAHFEEKQVGGERYNVFTGCPAAKTATISRDGFIAPRRVVITGTPICCASSTSMPKPSDLEGCSNTSANATTSRLSA